MTASALHYLFYSMKDTLVVIIEDERPAARSLQRKLMKLGYSHITLLHSVEQGKQWFKTHPEPDLLFLDIQLSDGLSFEILDELALVCPIIFTTAYDEFALKAFKVNSVDYLMKPIIEEELEAALAKYEKNHASKQPSLDMTELKALFAPTRTSYKSRFSIKIGQQIKLITIDDIECFFSENKGTYAFCSDGNQYLLDFTIDQLEKLLDPAIFFRISRGFLVHIKAIKSIAVHSNSRLKLYFHHYGNAEVIVSRERVNDFKAWIE